MSQRDPTALPDKQQQQVLISFLRPLIGADLFGLIKLKLKMYYVLLYVINNFIFWYFTDYSGEVAALGRALVFACTCRNK